MLFLLVFPGAGGASSIADAGCRLTSISKCVNCLSSVPLAGPQTVASNHNGASSSRVTHYGVPSEMMPSVANGCCLLHVPNAGICHGS